MSVTAKEFLEKRKSKMKMLEKGLQCSGCGRKEIHKMCPAWGTPFYMSGKEYTEADEKAYLSKKAEENKNRTSNW